MKDEDIKKIENSCKSYSKYNLIEAEIAKLLEEKVGMTEYLKLKMKQEDWHGVADAAMDIREIVAKLNVLEGL
jgi:hypothetical protein